MTFKNWDFTRVFKVILGLAFIGSYLDNKEWGMIAIGAIILYQGIANVGCFACNSGQCSIEK